MRDPHEVVEEALASLSKVRDLVAREKGKQVRSAETRSLVKANALTWFKSHRPLLVGLSHSPELPELDAEFRELLDATEKATTKARYLALIGEIKPSLMRLRGVAVKSGIESRVTPGIEPSPDFAKLIPDSDMQAILQRRWTEAQLCKRVGANLAATVMMGSLLEALLLAKVNSHSDKSVVFRAHEAPKDRLGKVLPLRDWGLRDYIAVAHELKWISQSGRDVGVVLRDYRNYVHPAKEFAHNVVLEPKDAEMFWAICRTLTQQLL